MNQRLFTGQDLQTSRPLPKPQHTDRYYLQLGNKLLRTFLKSQLDFGEDTPSVCHYTAATLVCYFEDIVADSGSWRMFSGLCQQMYGHPVPLYHDDEEYYPDEPSLNAVRYLVWLSATEMIDRILDADDNQILRMAEIAYELFEEAFEEAPVNEQLAKDTADIIANSSQNFDTFRTALRWIFSSCYVLRSSKSEELLQNILDDSADTDILPSASMQMYFALTQCIFNFRVGPLALYPKDYLAAFLRLQDRAADAHEAECANSIKMTTYKFDPIGNNRLHLTATNGREFDIDATELNLPKDTQKEFDGCIAAFVHFQGDWHLNGIMIPLDDAHVKWKEFCKDDPDNLKPETATLTGKELLKRARGRQLNYFDNREQLKKYLYAYIRFPMRMLGFVDESGGDEPMLFIDPEEEKQGLQFSYGLAHCVCDPDNHLYDPERAKQDVIHMIWDYNCISTAAVKYMLHHDYLPDLYDDPALSTTATHEQKYHDIDFLMRFHRREDF